MLELKKNLHSFRLAFFCDWFSRACVHGPAAIERVQSAQPGRHADLNQSPSCLGSAAEREQRCSQNENTTHCPSVAVLLSVCRRDREKSVGGEEEEVEITMRRHFLSWFAVTAWLLRAPAYV
ncbi:uncharacterized [Tachysurus ichikawai]